MNTLSGESTSLDELKHVVLAELAIAGRPERTAGVPLQELLSDRADADRYELCLHCLLDAVVALSRQ
jgi:hypothetical protein